LMAVELPQCFIYTVLYILYKCRYRVLVWDHDKVVELDGDDGYTSL
jgi:hypothetical protein